MYTEKTINKLTELMQEYHKVEKNLREFIINTIKEIAKEHDKARKKIGERIYLINYSEMIGNPWNVSFYAWEASAEVVLSYLNNKPVIEWKKKLMEKLEKSKGNVVEFEFKEKFWCFGYHYETRKEPINKDFIKKIVENL